MHIPRTSHVHLTHIARTLQANPMHIASHPMPITHTHRTHIARTSHAHLTHISRTLPKSGGAHSPPRPPPLRRACLVYNAYKMQVRNY